MLKNLEKNKIIIVVIAIITVIIITILIKKNTNDEIIIEEDVLENKIEDENAVLEERTNVIEDTEIEKGKIYVYITGEVNNSGVVILNEGSRIIDAINAAGGTTNNADISDINLVYIVEDGMKIVIPNSETLKNNPNFKCITSESSNGSDDENSIDEKVSEDTPDSKDKNNSKVNINTATQTELETLPGIGPSLALKIINYRKENGKFSSIDDIKNVNGIGESKFNSIKDLIGV